MVSVAVILTLAAGVSALRLPQTNKKLGVSSDFKDFHQTDWWPFSDDQEDQKAQVGNPADQACLPQLNLKKHRALNYYNKGTFPQNCAENPELCTVLKETANEKGQVIVGVLMGYMNTLPHFVQSLKKSGNDKHFVLAVLDEKAKQYAIDHGIKYWYKPIQISKSQDGGKITNHAVSSLKFALFQDFIKAGAKVLVSDLDVAYLSGDVFKYIYDDSDIEGMSDGWENHRAYGYDDVMDSPEMGWSRYHHSTRIFHFNSGLFYMNPTQESFNLMSTLADRVSKESIWDQAAFNDEILKPSSPGHKASDVMSRVMDIECFSNSRVLFSTLRDRKPNFRPVLTHLNAHPEKGERMEDTIKHYYDGDEKSWKRWSAGSGLSGSEEEKTNRAMGDALNRHFGAIPQTLNQASNQAKLTQQVKLKAKQMMKVDRSSSNYNVQIINHFDKGYTSVYNQWKKCAVKAMGEEAFNARVHTVDTSPKAASLLQTGANPSPELKKMLYTQLLEQLKQGKSAMHVEVDAFLQRDPNVLFEMYPDADIIGSIDVAGRKNSWYLGPRDKNKAGARGRHGGEDPFYPLGFMLNIGVAGLRSNENTISLLEEMLQPEVMKDVAEQWCGEQVIFSEKLFFRQGSNCTWTFKDGSAIPLNPRESLMSEDEYQRDPEPPMWQKFGEGKEAIGNCAGPKGNFKVVALPWKYTGRDDRPFQSAETVSHHPSGNVEMKTKAGETICSLV